MRPLTLILGSVLLVTACGGAATTPAASAAAPNTLTFTADLKAESEVPPVANEEKPCTGKATITIAVTRDAGKISGGTATADVSVSGLPASTGIILAHIHGPNGAAGKVASPIIGFKTDAANALPVTGTGTFATKWDNIKADGDAIQKIVDNPSDFYFNVHSKANQGGVCRGQLAKM